MLLNEAKISTECIHKYRLFWHADSYQTMKTCDDGMMMFRIFPLFRAGPCLVRITMQQYIKSIMWKERKKGEPTKLCSVQQRRFLLSALMRSQQEHISSLCFLPAWHRGSREVENNKGIHFALSVNCLQSVRQVPDRFSPSLLSATTVVLLSSCILSLFLPSSLLCFLHDITLYFPSFSVF